MEVCVVWEGAAAQRELNPLFKGLGGGGTGK